MCGIAGRFDPVALPPNPLWRERADRLLAHRGPDGSGHFVDCHCELVHRRLAIVDLSPAGRQPMANEDGSVLVVFNGEIYNHLELRRDLESRGHPFSSSSDTEVLVHLYEEYAAALVERLRGMFAFAIYDRRRRSLLLARDRFGIKPLYYARHGGSWIFASEMKAILALDAFVPRIDRQACYDYLGLGYVPEPATGFANIHVLPKGTTLTVDAQGARSRVFAELRVRPETGRSLSQVVASAGEALEKAVQAQSAADVPVAALLSGGIDSSLVVAAYCRAGGAAPRTFNVRFPDAAYDETNLARAVSERYGTRHQTIEIGASAMTPEAILDLAAHFDQPFADTSLIPTYWVCRAIQEAGIKCTVSGDGGDEAFGGYASFWRANAFARLMALPHAALGAMGLAGVGLVRWTADAGRQMAKAARLARAGKIDPGALLSGLSNYLSEPQKESLVEQGARAGLEPSDRLFAANGSAGGRGVESLSRRITESFFATSLPSDMLRKVDMMSMRASLEVRVPLLDEELVAVGLALPHYLKTDGRQGKIVLRRLAEEWLPPEVVCHPKHGFGIPLDTLATEPFHAMLGDLLLAPGARVRPFVNMMLAREWLRDFRLARNGHRLGGISREGLYQRVFILLSLEHWLRRTGLTW
jgi:asparagine synthase (glutamine-hydrolysing)